MTSLGSQSRPGCFCYLKRAGKAAIQVLGILAFLCAGLRGGAAPASVRPGEIIESVPCRRFPGQSYALYLPAAYTPQKKWPIVYAFDPGAQGVYPVRRYREVAEKYGYILAGSNNSQNFLAADEGAAIEAMLSDTSERLALDPRRIYTTGFSGGARVATFVAVRCTDPCSAAGVVASGATYPTNISPSKTDSFLYFMALGDTDFNYPEVVQTRLAKERMGSPYRVTMFPGPHHWAPASVFEEAVRWFQIRAMQAGTIPKDEAFIAEQKEQTLAEAHKAEQAHDSLRQFFAYKSLVEDFQGLANTSDVEPKLQSLKSSSGLKKALAREREDAETQQRLQGEVASNIARFSENPTRFDPEVRDSILSSMSKLKLNGQKLKDESQRRVYQRAFDGLFAQMMEEGQQRLTVKKSAEALPFFELMAEAAPERAWPPLGIAEARAAMGDHKRALKAVRQAVNTGRISAEILGGDRDLAPLFADSEFQKILEELKKQPPKQP